MPINMDALMQLLGAAGAGLNQQPWAQNVNALVQSGYGSKKQFNLIDIYRQILSGDIQDGKMDVSKDGMSLKLPPKFVSGMLGGEDDFDPLSRGPSPQPTPTPAPQPATSPSIPAAGTSDGRLSNIINPSGGWPSVSAADLAGLSPQDVSAALSGALNVEQLKQRKIANAADITYKGALTQESLARTKRMGDPDPLDKNFPIPHPEGGTMSLRQWSSLPAEEKEFAAYVHAAKRLGAPEEELTREFFMTLEPPERQQYIEWLMDTPEAMETEKELRRAGMSHAGVSKVTWTTATKELTKRFGKLDPTGMWAVTPDLQYTHRLAQRILTELKDEGVEPLKAINEAEDRSRNKQQQIEKRYQQYMDAAKQIKRSGERDRKIEEIKSLFYKRYGYLPATEVAR